MKFLKQTLLPALAVFLGLGLVGCQPSDPAPPGVATVLSITVTPNPVQLEVGGVQALSVNGSFSDGSNWVVTFDSGFASSSPAVATVDAATGYVTAVAPGTATITATHRPSGRLASTVVTVAPLRVMSIAVSPAAASLAVGGTQSLNVIATYNNGTTGPVTAGSTFVSSNTAVATVDAAGLVSAVADGTATITATHTESGKTATASVTVSPVPSGPFTSITFDEPGVIYTLTGFGGAEDSTLVPDPAGGANTVARVVKSAAAELWAGTTVSTGPNNSVAPIPFSATEQRMTVRVYSPKAGIPVRLKVEDAADPTRSVETEATTTVVNAWQTLTFDFGNPVASTSPLNLAYTYNKLSIFFDFGRSGPDGGDGTYHFDDVTFVTGSSGPSGNTGTCSAPCIDFSSPSVKFEPFEGLVSAAQADDPVDATNKVAKFVKGPAGQPWAGATIYTVDADKSVPEFDLSTSKVVTLRVYAPAAGQKIRLKLEDAANNAIYLEKDAVTTVANQWETLSFDFAAPDNGTYDPANTYNKVSVFPLFLILPTAEVTFYFDELKYTTTSSGPDSGNTGTCSAPCIDFSSASVQYTPFEGLVSAAQADDPVDATNKVAQFVKGPAGQPWAGATIYTEAANQSVPKFDLSTNKVVTLRVFAPAAGQKVRLKLEDASNGAIVLEKDAITTVANQWETLSFDFAAPDNGTYDPANTYNRVSVFPMFLELPTAEVTYYFDELKYTTSASSGPSVFASNYSQLDPMNWRSTEGGDAGTYIDTSVPTQYWWNGVAPADATPSFYFGYGINTNARPWGFGAFVKAPGNGTADVTGQTNLKIAVWGNDELMNTRPTLTLILKGPTVSGCTSELKGSVSVAAPGVQNYTVALGTFTLQTPCAYPSADAALAAGVTEVHVQVLGTNVQYVTGGPVDFPNGLNVGPIRFE